MARHDALYTRAKYYDIALQRDVSREVDFIVDVYSHHAAKPLQSLLEIGCGPGYHARALAARGISVTGLDISPTMLDLAREYASEDGVDVTWVEGDMRDIGLNEPVDMAVCLFDGVDALLTDQDFDDHFVAVAGSLSPTGLYLIDCTHPRDCSLSNYGNYEYHGSRDGVDVQIFWGTNHPSIDPVTGIAEVSTLMRVRENGHEIVVEDSARERCLSAQELRFLAERSGVFRVAEWYGAFSLRQPLDNSSASERMILILRKRHL